MSKDPDTDLLSTWRVTINDSNINFITDLSKFEESYFGPIVNHARSVMGTMINLLSLSDGIPYSFNFDRFVLPNGETRYLAIPRESALSDLITATKGDDFQKILNLALFSNPVMELEMILRDVTDCLRYDYVGLIGLARAMDGICNHFIPNGGERDDGWPLMHVALNTTKAYVQSISDISRGPRHADWTPIEEPIARKAMERAWAVMNRYLEYRKRGNQALSAPEFPLLELPQA